MLPALKPDATLETDYASFLSELSGSAFSGDIEYSYASRLAVATDNSIYQRLPQAVVFPRGTDDVIVIGTLAKQYPKVCFSARGGGTGTNGQSLTSGIVVDMSRYMNNILEINAEQGWVTVQAGVVKDQLNDALREHGFFFAPDLSTSNRATIGGMINTDASGQGSLVYGKTSDHVLALTSVLADGTLINSAPMPLDSARQLVKAGDRAAQIIEQLLATCVEKRDRILAKFPRLNRFLTGYDLEHAISDDVTELDISRILTGSEGSLAFITEAKLNVTPIPKNKALVNIKYDSFESALRHAPRMIAADATSVETVDSKVLNLAREDIIWHSVSELITDVPDKHMLGLNMVEYNSDDEQEIQAKIARLSEELRAAAENGEHGVIGFQVTFDVADINKIYAMRKKAVGLLGKAKGWQKPIAFAEDTAVPPEHLADFIMEFRDLLDSHQLQYGMFGHVDAGVLHVRPALDMSDPEQEKLMKRLSDKVVELVAKYGGLMWGEHGKGYRSEYAPAFFGDELYAELQKIKRAFDPHNQMNPGKICTPFDSGAQLVSVDDVKRGSLDRQIPIHVRNAFEPAMSCNGNALCFNYDVSSPMCPSSKITRDRRHTPKGRAGMIREWLRLLSTQGQDVTELENGTNLSWWARWRNSQKKSAEQDFSHEVLEVMNGCLACKSCSSQCPVGVDVPEFRARFLNIYYQRYLRPVKDYLVANVERMAPLMAKFARPVNWFLKRTWLQRLFANNVGYVDMPLLSTPTLAHRIAGRADWQFNLATLEAMPERERNKVVLVVQDPFTSFYEAELVEDFMRLIDQLGYRPMLLPFKPNGKPQHVKGFLKQFAATAKNTAAFLNSISQAGCSMVGVDASLVLCYRDEYVKALGQARGDFTVQIAHEWLLSLPEDAFTAGPGDNHEYKLFAHCTEKTALPKSEQQWQQIFARAGLSLTPVAVGCCGMAGTYGHEVEQLENSKGIFNLSWQPALQKLDTSRVLATGYSCRSQVSRIDGYKPQHPLQVLLSHLHTNE
ncbi:D-2-hydroxyglutarate dehydrogenase YdiJ [Aestuariibacter salexigens]|uniref:D-2-hydroxyglutarate dehydrogenase YdiJ n=1 Tax=Aestuariibacter salexigens TaxID=226010 RepID=UPI0003FE6DC9|nr:FAD-binding and (Fe-S)-binding domain-containing protein [Aestuariibacter salexigens]